MNPDSPLPPIARFASSESLLAGLWQTSREAFLLLDANYRILCASPAAEKVFGTGTLENLDYLQLLHPEDLPWVSKVFPQVWHCHVPSPPCPMRYRIMTPMGTPRWVESSGTTILADNGSRCILLALGDIHRAHVLTQKQPESPQITTQSFSRDTPHAPLTLGLMLQAVLKGPVLFNKAGQLLPSQAGTTALHAPDITQILLSEKDSHALEHFLSGHSPEVPSDAITELGVHGLKPDGSRVPLTLRLSCSVHNGEPQYSATLADTPVPEVHPISHLLYWRNATNAAIESRHLLDTSIEHFDEAVVITDACLDAPGPSILFVNPAFCRMTGYTPQEVLGRSPRILQGPNTNRQVLSHLKQRLRCGKRFDGETINYRKDGSEYHLLWHISPVRNTEGTITHFISIQTNLDGLGCAEAEVHHSRRLHALGEVTGSIAHEFNNLLQPILLEIIQARKSANTHELAASLGNIESSIRSAAELCQRVLALRNTNLNTTDPVELSGHVRFNVDFLRKTFDPRIQFSIQTRDDLPPLLISRSQLAQVITQLCVNARDTLLEKLTSSHDPGWVPTIEVRTSRTLLPSIEDRPAGAYQCLTVRDNGCGMPESVSRKLFHPFFTTKSTGSGTGLGLAMVWNIITVMKGWLEVDTQQGAGTEFRVWLPEPADSAGNTPAQIADSENPQPTTNSIPQGTARIMLVEDSAPVAQTFGSLLRACGHELAWMANGAEAWKHLQTFHSNYDLIISDMNMPGLQGNNLVQNLREAGYRKRIAVISGFIPEDIQKQLEAQHVEILLKPVDPDTLIDLVARSASH